MTEAESLVPWCSRSVGVLLIAATMLAGSFKGFLKGVYKGSIVGFYGSGPLII